MSSSKRPWYPWYPKDFTTDEKVQCLPPLAELIYRRALDILWQSNDTRIPNACDLLWQSLGKGIARGEFDELWGRIMYPGFELFTVSDDEKWIFSKRLMREAEHINNCIERKSVAGQKGANARWQKHCDRNAKAMRIDSHTDTHTDIKEKVFKKENPQKGKTALPQTFIVTDEMISWFKSQNYTFNIQTETDRFMDYWKANGGMKKDWVATWRNWMRNQEKFARNQRPQYTPGYEANVPRQPVFDGVKRYAD